MLAALAACVTSLLGAARSGAHVPLAAVDEAQEAIGAAYSLLQLHAPWLASRRGGPAAHAAIAAAGRAMLALMQVVCSAHRNGDSMPASRPLCAGHHGSLTAVGAGVGGWQQQGPSLAHLRSTVALECVGSAWHPRISDQMQ